MNRILVVNGPNLDKLGSREPDIYGLKTLADLEACVRAEADLLGVQVDFFQTNSEQAMIKFIESKSPLADGIILNAGILTHYSELLRDALAKAGVETIEVHISNIHGREEFRRRSIIAPVCVGQIAGLGIRGYCLALRWFANRKDE